MNEARFGLHRSNEFGRLSQRDPSPVRRRMCLRRDPLRMFGATGRHAELPLPRLPEGEWRALFRCLRRSRSGG